MIDFVNHWSREKTGLPSLQVVDWLGLGRSKFYNWKGRYGRDNEHNAAVPRDHWLQAWEKKAILDDQTRYPLEGYRRLTFMMLDEDIVAVSPSSTYRVLREAGVLARWNCQQTVSKNTLKHSKT